MAHYAFLDENNVVVKVIAGIDEDSTETLPSEFSSWEEFYSNHKGMTCKRCSYNTIMGTHRDGGTPFRGTYPGQGYIYDETDDTLSEEDIIAGKTYNWNEDNQEWDLYTP